MEFQSFRMMNREKRIYIEKDFDGFHQRKLRNGQLNIKAMQK